MNYREATHWDIPTITNMWSAMMKELDAPGRYHNDVEQGKFFTSLTMKLANKQYPYKVYVAEDEEVVGFVMGGLANYDYGASNLVIIEHIYVMPSHRNEGVAKYLGVMAEEWAKDIGANQIEVHAAPQRKSVWERFGYKELFLIMQKNIK